MFIYVGESRHEVKITEKVGRHLEIVFYSGVN